MLSGNPSLLMDANVLIDYARTDPSVLALATAHLGPVYVLPQTLDIVENLTHSDCQRLGLRIADPSANQALMAAIRQGSLAFDDHLCLIVSRDNGWVCVTNDRALRNACADSNVPTLWGLQIMVELVRRDELTPSDSIAIARKINAINPRHITDEIVARFVATVSAMK